MDIVLLSALALLIFILIITITWLSRKGSKKKVNNVQEQIARGQPIQRAAGVRGVRQRRTQRPVPEQVQEQILADSNEEADDEGQVDESSIDLSKVGSKKRAKLEAKAEKKAQREIAERDREDRKRRQQLEQEERDRQSEKEREQERKRAEAEKKAREEKEKRDHEEYLKMKEAFNVEEEGFEEGEDDEAKRDLLNEFIEYIKSNKVVVLEDLATHFGLKTASAIERIQQLQTEGVLSGVIDDRGKFIYISQEELLSVAKFIKQRGRVSITELVEHSNSLINLNPEKKIIETN